MGGMCCAPTNAPDDTVETYITHSLDRVAALRRALQASSTLRVTIAGEDGALALGTGAAVKQWKRRFPDGARERFLAQLEPALQKLQQDYPERVQFGTVSGADAGPEHFVVWGANARNWNLPEGSRISGSGQAAAMGVQKPGIFGIVTTPKYPLVVEGGGQRS